MPPQTARQPWTRYRPTRADTGGGYTETLSQGATALVWGSVEVHQDRVTLEIDTNEDVLVGDVLTVDETIGNF